MTNDLNSSSGDVRRGASFSSVGGPVLVATAFILFFVGGLGYLFSGERLPVTPEAKRTCDELSREMVADAFIRFGGELRPEVRKQLVQSLKEQLNDQGLRGIERSEKLKRIVREHAEMKQIIESQGLDRTPKPKPDRKTEGEPLDPDKALRDAVEQGFPDGESYFGVS